VAALLAAEACPGDTAFDFSSPKLSVQLSLPAPSSVTAASLAAAHQGSRQHSRMVRTMVFLTKWHPLRTVAIILDGATFPHLPLKGAGVCLLVGITSASSESIHTAHAGGLRHAGRAHDVPGKFSQAYHQRSCPA
jgi:hypothetical protein